MIHRWLVLVLVSTAACSSIRTPSTGDLLLTNARVYTLRWDSPDTEGRPAAGAPCDQGRWRPDAQAIWIRAGRIAFVGTEADAAARVGSAVRTIDLGGAVVLPGLVESHTHVAELGSNLAQVSLVGVATEEEAVAKVGAHARAVPGDGWIFGHGWDDGAWADRYPTFELLTRAVPDRPVVLKGLHGFAVWGNRLAFERARITAATPDPSGGEILRGEGGVPSGVLLNRATALLLGAVPDPTDRQREDEILAGLHTLAAAGYVAIDEAGVDAPTLAAFERLAAAGRLPLHARLMLSARERDLCRTWLERGPSTEPRGRLVVRSVKAFYDGALGSRGAALLEEYADRPGYRGIRGNVYQFDADLVTALMSRGFQLAIHAIGDRGNRETLDLYERVFAEHPEARSGRHRIEHAQVVHADDFARFGRLGITASMEPPHAVEDKAWAEDRLGKDRVRGAYAWRTLRRAGAHLIFNSDLPGSDWDFFYGLHAAVTRRDKNLEPPDGWYPEQCLTVEEAVRAYTSEAAWAAFEEGVAGIIAPGRRADLTVVTIDPFELAARDPAAILGGAVRMTIVAGDIVYDSTNPTAFR